MTAIDTAFKAYSDLNLWIKVQLQDSLKLTDIPALINQRIFYIIENWSTLRPLILERSNQSEDPSRMQNELVEFDGFVSFARAQQKSTIQTIPIKTYLFKYYTVFDQMLIEDIPISQPEADIVQAETVRVNSFTKNNFLTLRKQLVDGRDAIADTISSTDSTYNSVYRRSALPALQSKNITDLIYCGLFQNGIYVIDGILANEKELTSVASIDPFAFARANANNPEVNISSYATGTLVKLNYGETMQMLARRTLGDADRWIEIAIANGLKPPYIDEVGKKIPLYSNGRLNQIVISGIDASGMPNKDKVVINQIVILQSDTESAPDQRVITSIKEIQISGDLVIQLDGEPNLDKYKVNENASVRVYEKNTINSNFYVLIPSNEPAPPSLNKPDPWFLRSKSQDEKNAKVDLFLSNDGDLMFSPSGDLKLSYGAENATQAVKILLSTPLSTLGRHEAYGVVDVTGEKNRDSEYIKQTISESIARQILSDSRFNRLDYLTVEYLSNSSVGPSGYSVSLGVVLSGGADAVIPITFSVNIPQ